MKKQLIWLSILVLVVVAASTYLLTKSDNFSSPQRSALFESLSNQADKIDLIEVSNHAGLLLNATHKNDGWHTELSTLGQSYPLDERKLAELVKTLSKAELLEAKTSKQANFVHLGLQDVQQADSQALLVTVRASGKSYQVLVGNQASSGQGSYVRLVDKRQTWLLDSVVSLPTTQFEWLKQPILDIENTSVVSVQRSGADPLRIIESSAQSGTFVLANLNASQALKYDSIVDGYVDNILNLRFEQIISQGESLWQGPAKPTLFLLTLDDGVQVELALIEHEQSHYVRFTALSNSGKYYWDGLTYQISSFSAGQLNKTLNDFIQSAEQSSAPASPTMPIDEGESPQ